MSVLVMGLVWSAPPDQLPPNQRLVLLAYADHANDDGSSVYPGEEAMALKTGYSIPSIRRITAELLDLGFLIRVQRGYRSRRAAYRVNTAALRSSLNAYQDKRLSEGKASHERTESLSPASEKPITSDMPNHHEPSIEPSSSLTHVHRWQPLDGDETSSRVVCPECTMQRDLLWEVFTEIHGAPASSNERGKFNAIVKKLRDADPTVTHHEYPTLVRAYVSKHRGLQPAAATVAERIGELRHYAMRGPMQAPDPEALEQERKWQRAIEQGDPDDDPE